MTLNLSPTPNPDLLQVLLRLPRVHEIPETLTGLPCSGYYVLVDWGRVVSTRAERHPEKVVAPRLIGHVPHYRTRHLRVAFYHQGARTRRYVHQIICALYHGEKPEPGMMVLHADGDAQNNRPENLRWGTISENSYDYYRHQRERAEGGEEESVEECLTGSWENDVGSEDLPPYTVDPECGF